MIDWAAAKARLLEINGSKQASPQQERELMAARARLLGRAPAAADSGRRIDLVRFECGGERFGLQTPFVQATLRLPKVSPVPFGPAALLGLCAFRGQLLSVWDPAALLTAAAPGPTADWLLVLGKGSAELGLAVRDVTFVQQLSAGEVVALPEALGGSSRSQLFEGLISEQSVRVLSGAAILAAPELTWS